MELRLPESVKREVLYELVWSEPLTQLALRFGVSDVALAKICKKMRIPVPGRGYWAKTKAGQGQSSRPQLKIDASVPMVHYFNRTLSGGQGRPRRNERLSDMQIDVSDHLVSPHRLVMNTQRKLNRQKPDDTNLLNVQAKNCLDVKVSRPQVDRSLCLLDALLKSIERSGYVVSVRDKHPFRTYVSIDKTEIAFRLKERLNRVQHQPDTSSQEQWAAYERSSDFVPNGKLALVILDLDYLGLGVQTTWSDGKKQRLEACLGPFIAGLRVAADAKLAYEVEREQRHKAWEEEYRRRREQQLRQQEEEERVKALLHHVDLWSRSQQIKAFIAAVRSDQSKMSVDLQSWLEWAEGVADKMDPLAKTEVDLITAPGKTRIVDVGPDSKL